MSTWTLSLYEDILPPQCLPVYLSHHHRTLYMVSGQAMIEAPQGCRLLREENAWIGSAEVALVGGASEARIWRWELAGPDRPDVDGLLRSAPAARTMCKLSAQIVLDDAMSWLMRCDRVAFPKGGIAYTHVHQGPGIRCCLKGAITTEVHGVVNTHPKDHAWMETGPEPVLAPTSKTEETAFVRCSILPQSCKGRSSIRYVLPEDLTKDKPQAYMVFAEQFICLHR